MSRYWKENRWNKTESSETTLIALMAKWSYNLIFRSAIWNDEKKIPFWYKLFGSTWFGWELHEYS